MCTYLETEPYYGESKRQKLADEKELMEGIQWQQILESDNGIIKEQGSLMSTPVVTCCHLWHLVGRSNHQATTSPVQTGSSNTCIKVFLFIANYYVDQAQLTLHTFRVAMFQCTFQLIIMSMPWLHYRSCHFSSLCLTYYIRFNADGVQKHV